MTLSRPALVLLVLGSPALAVVFWYFSRLKQHDGEPQKRDHSN